MSYTPDPKGINAPFDIVRRGYDRDQVLEFLRRFDAELRLTATDRDAAAAQTNDLAAQLDDAREFAALDTRHDDGRTQRDEIGQQGGAAPVDGVVDVRPDVFEDVQAGPVDPTLDHADVPVRGRPGSDGDVELGPVHSIAVVGDGRHHLGDDLGGRPTLGACDDDEEFAFALDLALDGLERARVAEEGVAGA